MTLEPLVATGDARADARLVGRWSEAGGDTALVKSVAGERDYVIEYITDSRSATTLRARLGRLGNADVLDVWPDTGGRSAINNFLFVPTHLVFAVEIGDSDVRLTPLLGDSVVAAMARAHIDLTHTAHDDGIVLHGSTSQVRTALAAAITARGSRDSMTLWRRTATQDR